MRHLGPITSAGNIRLTLLKTKVTATHLILFLLKLTFGRRSQPLSVLTSARGEFQNSPPDCFGRGDAL